MKKIIIFAVIFITFIALLGYSHYLQGVIDNLLEKQKETQLRYLETLSEFTQNYNNLQDDYNRLYLEYHKLASQKGFYDGWEVYTVTAYTSLDPGCNSISAINVNIEKLSNYFNFCATDPNYIPFGSIVLVKIGNTVVPFLAVDSGKLVKGRHIDLYFANDRSQAYFFGKRELEVKVLK